VIELRIDELVVESAVDADALSAATEAELTRRLADAGASRVRDGEVARIAQAVASAVEEAIAR
jgi:hypothetical protein